MAKDAKNTGPETGAEPTQDDVEAAVKAHNAEEAKKATEAAKEPTTETSPT